MKKIWIVVLLMLLLVGCSSSNEENNKKEEEKEIITEYYKDDESINLFINKYNKMYDPDITSDMISKKHIGGIDRDDVVIISNAKLELVIYGANKYGSDYKMSVYVGYKNGSGYTNEDFKEWFLKLVKMFDENLSDSEIENHWNDMISEYRSSYKINEIEIWPNISVGGGKITYYKIESKIDF